MFSVIKEHISYFGQIFSLAKADLVKTYRGSFLGWFWAILKPSITIFVYWFTFAIGLRVSKTLYGYPYFLWLISGILPWFYMQDVLHQGTESIRKYDYLVTKMKFPISCIPTFVSVSKFIVHILLLFIVICIFLFAGYPLDIYLLQLPLYSILLFLFFTTLSLLLSTLSAVSKDFLNLVKSCVFALFWLSGIIWDANSISIPIFKIILKCNPICFLVNGYRNCFIHKVWFWEDPLSLVIFLVLLFVVTFLACFVYKKLKKDLPDLL